MLPLGGPQTHPKCPSWPWGSCPLTPALGCWAQGSTGPGCEHSQHPVCLQVTFTITNENHKFHGLPLLSPWSYTTYRGSLQLTGSQPVTLDMVPQQPSHPQAAGQECSSWAPGSHFPWDILAPCHRCRCHSGFNKFTPGPCKGLWSQGKVDRSCPRGMRGKREHRGGLGEPLGVLGALLHTATQGHAAHVKKIKSSTVSLSIWHEVMGLDAMILVF